MDPSRPREWSRWTVLVAGIYVSLWCGTTYAFDFHWTQAEVQNIGTIGNIGSYIGLFYDRVGPRKCIWVGCVFTIVGWGLLYLFTARILDSSQAAMAIAYFVGANGQTWYDTGALVTNIGNFPWDRSMTIGLEKAYTGLGASVFSEVYTALFKARDGSDDGVTPFLMALCICSTAVPLLCSIFIVKLPETSERSFEPVKTRFAVGYTTTTSLAAALLVCALLQFFFDVSDAVRYLLLAIVATFLASVSLMPHFGRNKKEDLRQAINDSTPLIEQRGPAAYAAILGEMGLLKAMQTIDFWLIFVVSCIGTGAGITVINNITQMYLAVAESDDATSSDATVFVALLSVANCVGRLIIGVISQKFERAIPRPLFVGVATVMMTAGMLYFAFATEEMLHFGCILVGLAYGAYWALLPTTTSDLFGHSSLGANYNFLSVGTALGTYVMCVQLAGRIYDDHASSGPDPKCRGRDCFFETYIIITGLCVAATFASLWLIARTWNDYLRCRAR